jgi:hypothetical protein
MPDLKNSIKEIRKYFSLHLTEKLPLFVKFFHPMPVMEFSANRNGKSWLILTIPVAFFTVKPTGHLPSGTSYQLTPLAPHIPNPLGTRPQEYLTSFIAITFKKDNLHFTLYVLPFIF